MTQIAVFPSLEEAYIAKGMLEANGIDSRVEQSGVSSIFPAPGAYNGGISLYVNDEMAAEATKLLKEHGDLK